MQAAGESIPGSALTMIYGYGWSYFLDTVQDSYNAPLYTKAGSWLTDVSFFGGKATKRE